MPELIGEIIFDTGPIKASTADPSGLHWFNYTNGLIPKYFRSLSIFMGMVKGGVADFGANIVQYVGSSENWLVLHGWDHYADPTKPTSETYYFSPDYYRLGAGETLTMAVRITPERNTDPDGHVVVLGRYTVGL